MLRLNSVTKTYANGVRALDGVTLSIPKGLFGLLGPNGAGKSSLMRTLATLQTVDEGTIHFAGMDVLQQPQELRRRLGYLPQYFGVYPGVSAEHLLDHLALLKGISQAKQRREQVAELLQQTNLYAQRKKAVSGFSGGMRQRFGIAQALLGDPDLLIVDEPTAGLDPEERHHFNNLLVALGQEKVVLLSTHIVEDVAELCTQVAVLAQGRILLQGQTQELIQALAGQVWAKTVRQEELPQLVKSLPVISQRLSGGETLLHVRAASAPPGFSAIQPSLEDVYFSSLMALRAEQELRHVA